MAGPVLALITWIGASIAIMAAGLPLAAWAGRGRPLASVLRSSLWWGLLVMTITVLTVSIALPLRSAGAAIAVIGVVVTLGAAGLVALWRGAPRARDLAWRGRWWLLPLLVVMAGAMVYLAAAAMGPLTNYDSGLYHLGAVAYAGDYAAIPGLANLYFPFGYSNSIFPLAAFMGNGPWGGEGFRLINGLVLMLLAVDIGLRLMQRRYSAGTFVMLVGALAAWVPLLTFADNWVTSPSQDSSVLVLTVVTAAYLSDALARQRRWQPDAAVAMVTCLVLVSMRPLMAFFAIGTAAVIVVRALRSRSARARRSGSGGVALRPAVWAVVGLLALTLAAVQTARDYVLSGWVQYPLGFLPFDVAWRAPDPSAATAATLWAARDPGLDWQSAEGWGWVLGWLTRLPLQWEPYELAVFVALAVVATVVAWRRSGAPPRRAILLAMAPSALTVLVWWTLTPPSFRFAWGPVLMLAVIPTGWAIHAISVAERRHGRRAAVEQPVSLGLAVVVAVLLAYCSVARLDVTSATDARSMSLGPVTVAYLVAPLPEPSTTTFAFGPDLIVRQPVESDQCWRDYPLCVGAWPQSLHSRGPSLQDGFTP